MTVAAGAPTGRVAVVTGGASGLGEAIAQRLRSEGAAVVVADVDQIGARRVAEQIGGEAHTVDVTKEAEVAGLFATVRARHGRLDSLVCSAAVETRASVVECEDEDWQRVIDANLKGPFLCLKHGLPLMVEGEGGSAVLLGSVLGAIGSPGYAAYCASKAALVNLAKQAAIEHAAEHVRVNVVSPTACEAGLFLKVAQQAPDPDAVKAMVAERTPMQRLGRADDVVDAVMFLVGEGSTYISGTVIPLDGGLAARRA